MQSIPTLNGSGRAVRQTRKRAQPIGWAFSLGLLWPLLGLLALFSCLGAAASRFGLGFLLGNVSLGVSLVLLGLALAD